MPTLRFPYIPDVYIDPETQEVRYLYRPYVPVQLGYQGTEASRLTDCLLDSGGDFTLFPAYLGEQALEFRWRANREAWVMVSPPAFFSLHPSYYVNKLLLGHRVMGGAADVGSTAVVS